MAFTKILIISLFAAVQAGFARQDFDRTKPFQMNHMFYPTPPRAPFLPGFGRMMLPTPPFHHFGHMMMPTPPFSPSMIKVPTPGEMASIEPGPGREFHGISVSSHSGVTRDKDGNLVRTGGTTVVTNKNGDVQKMEVGDNPPDINKPIIIPPFHHFEIPEMPEFKHIKMPEFEPIKMPEFEPIKMPEFEPMKMHEFKPMKRHEFKPIKVHEFKPIKMPKFKPIIIEPIVSDNPIPSKGNSYVSVVESYHSESSDNNGVKSSSGGALKMVNNNGKIQTEKREFRDDDKEEMKKKREEEKNKKRNENKKQKKRGDDDDVTVDDE